jgi:hypothetical protein
MQEATGVLCVTNIFIANFNANSSSYGICFSWKCEKMNKDRKSRLFQQERFKFRRMHWQASCFLKFFIEISLLSKLCAFVGHSRRQCQFHTKQYPNTANRIIMWKKTQRLIVPWEIENGACGLIVAGIVLAWAASMNTKTKQRQYRAAWNLSNMRVQYILYVPAVLNWTIYLASSTWMDPSLPNSSSVYSDVIARYLQGKCH